MATRLERLDDLLEREVGTRSIAVVRVAVGLVAAWHLWPIAADALRGDTYRDRFHEPFFDWWFDGVPDLPTGLYATVLVAGVVAAGAMTLGAFTRAATVTTTLVVGYHLALSTTHLHNNRAYLFAILLGLSLAPAGRSWSVDRWWAARRGDPPEERMMGWPLWLLRFECSLIYAASGFSKLVDPDWFGGTVTWGRIITQEATVRASVLPEFVVDLLVDRSFHTLAAKVVVLTELFIAAGFWWRGTRPWAVATAIVFHISIEVSAQVQTFSYLALGVLFVWADPATSGIRHQMSRFRRVAA